MWRYCIFDESLGWQTFNTIHNRNVWPIGGPHSGCDPYILFGFKPVTHDCQTPGPGDHPHTHFYRHYR